MKRLVLSASIAASLLAGCGTDAPSAEPTPSAASTAPTSATLGGVVEFQFDGSSATTEVDAVADDAGISGSAVTTSGADTHAVKLECAHRDGDTWAFGGTVEESTIEAGAVGSWSAVVVRDGPPQEVAIWLSGDKSDGVDCAGWLESVGLSGIGDENFEPVESGELVPPA